MTKKNKVKQKNIKYYVISAIVMIIVIGFIIFLVINSNSFLYNKENEYWVAEKDIKVIDEKNNKYEYNSGSILFSFDNNGKCELLVMNMKYYENEAGSERINLFDNRLFYDENLNNITPSGTWISRRVPECTYKKTDDTIIIETNYKEIETLIGTYKKIDNDKMLITWSDTDISNITYRKVLLKEYINEFYYLSGMLSLAYTYETKKVSFPTNEMKTTKLDGRKKDYVDLDDFIDFLEKKYGIDDIDANVFISLNPDFKNIVYYNNKEYSEYNNPFDTENIILPVSKSTEEKISSRIMDNKYGKKEDRSEDAKYVSGLVKLGHFDKLEDKYYIFYIPYRFNSAEEMAYYFDGTVKDYREYQFEW